MAAGRQHRPNPSALAFVVLGVFAMAAGSARSQELVEPTIHWAYAAFFGTGWYKISDERRAFILKADPRWTRGEAGFDEEGRREIGYTFRLPVTLGVSRLDFEDIPGILDPDNLAIASVGVGAAADVPVTERWSVRPAARIGYGTVLAESDSAFTWQADVRARYARRAGRLDWALLGGLGVAGYTPDEGSSNSFSVLAAVAEFAWPVTGAKDDPTMLYWHVGYTEFVDEIEFANDAELTDSVSNFWQIGAAFGKRNRPMRLGFLSFDRLGLAYKFSTSGDLRGVNLVFRSYYDL